MMFRSIWIAPLALALAACPTYSESSRHSAEDDDEAVAEARESDQAGDHEPVLDVEGPDDDHDGAEADDEAEADDGSAAEVEGEEGMVMHREEAGEPDESGWYAATSTNGGFSVQMPGPFDDYEVDPELEEEQVMHVVQASKDDVRYLVQCSVGGKSPEEKLAAIEEQLPHLGDVEQQRRVQHAGGEGVEFRLTGGATTITIRSLALDEALCQMIVEARGVAYPERDGARFIQSFALADQG